MIQSLFAECDVCKQKMRLRIGFGHLNKQKHSFICKSCQAPITVEVELKPPRGITDIIFENANMIGKVDEYITYNFSQTTAIPVEYLHDDMYPFQLIENVRLFENKIPDVELSSEANTFEQALQNWEEGQYNKHNCKVLETVLNMYLSTTPNNEIIIQYLHKNFKTKEHHANVLHYIFEHNTSLAWVGGDGAKEFTNLLEIFDKAFSKNKTKYQKFHKYHEICIFKERLRQYKNIMKMFCGLYEVFNQIEKYRITQTPIPDGFILSDESNEEAISFYGNLYEAYLNNFETLYYLGNLYRDKKFQFQKDEFLQLKKGSRISKVDGVFKYFMMDIDSKLRHAIAHNSYRFVEGKIFYRNKVEGKWAEEEEAMTYAQFLMICNDLLVKYLMLTQLEIVISYKNK